MASGPSVTDHRLYRLSLLIHPLSSRCCGTCGKVLDQDIYSDEPTFISYGPGQSRVEGTPLRSIEIGTSLSHERTLMKGRDEIWQIVTSLHVGGGDTIIDMAHKIYTLAVDHNFTRGRRTTQVAAACLYIASGKNIEDFLAKADEEQPSHKSGEVLCKHKDKDAEHLAHGLCEKCYNKFIKMSGGLEGGADPPAFQQAEKQRLEAAKKAEEAAAIKEAALGESNCEIQNSDVEDNMICPMKEQAAKEALAAELAARGVRVGGGQPKKRRRNEDTKNLSPAETPAEATYNMLKQKGLGSKINIEAVGGLYDTKDEDGEADEKGDMGFDGEYTQDIGDGETFEGGYDYADYNNNGYGGAGDYTDHDDF